MSFPSGTSARLIGRSARLNFDSVRTASKSSALRAAEGLSARPGLNRDRADVTARPYLKTR